MTFGINQRLQPESRKSTERDEDARLPIGMNRATG